jgi:glycosyltransferase involved in cell wall biosynthesis
MIDATACGTPIIAFRSGSVPEVVDECVAGFIIGGEEEAVYAIKHLGRLPGLSAVSKPY